MSNLKTLVGRTSTAIRNSADKTEIMNHYELKLNIKGLFLGRHADEALMKEFIQVRIDNYSAKVGYPVTIEASEVLDYFLKSSEIFSWLRTVLRRGNASQLRNNQGVDLGKVLTRRHVNYTTDAVITSIYNGVEPLAEGDDPIYNFSNSKWAELIGKASSVAIAPVSWLMQLSYFLDPYFSNNLNSQEGYSELMSIDIDTVLVDNIPARINELIGELSALSFAEPFLMSFFQTEFDNLSGIHSFDFTRDLACQTITIVNDDQLISKLNTTLAAAVRLTSINTVFPAIENHEFFRDYGIEYSGLEYPSIQNVPAEKLIYMMLLDSLDETATIRLNPVVTTLTTGATAVPEIKSRFFLHPGDLFAPSAEGSFPKNLTIAMQHYPLFTPFYISYIYGEAGMEMIVTLKSNPNLFMFNEDDVQEARIDFKLEQLFGSEMYMNKPINAYAGLGLAEEGTTQINQNPTSKRGSNKDKGQRNKDNK